MPIPQPYPHQADAIKSVWTYFEHNSGNPLVCMPTGTGKSKVIGWTAQSMLQAYPRTRMLMATHVKELIKGNAAAIQEIWPTAPLGILSAGLKRKDTSLPIIYGGIQTMINYIPQLGYRDLMLVDEAHLISPTATTRYRLFIDEMRKLNPKFKVIGFTATGYRQGIGHLTNGGIFTDVCYDNTGFHAFNQLVLDGYLSPLVTKRTQEQLQVSEVAIRGGEFVAGDLQRAIDQHDITYRCCVEMCQMAALRNHWIVFCAGVDHAQHTAEILNRMGVPTLAVWDGMGDAARDYALAAFRNGEIRCLTNNNILTTGHDFPFLDFIGMLRPTNSTGLWVQMLGRGTRVYLGKKNCLVADFAGNTLRLGPVNDPVIPTAAGRRTGDVPIKLCPICGSFHHVSVKFCDECGHEFISNGGGGIMANLSSNASELEVMRTADNERIEEWFDVQRVMYHRHQKEGSKPCVKVSYICGLRTFTEWVFPEGKGLQLHEAHDFWRKRNPQSSAFDENLPTDADDFLKRVNELFIPRRIKVWLNRKYPEVVDVEMGIVKQDAALSLHTAQPAQWVM